MSIPRISILDLFKKVCDAYILVFLNIICFFPNYAKWYKEQVLFLTESLQRRRVLLHIHIQ